MRGNYRSLLLVFFVAVCSATREQLAENRVIPWKSPTIDQNHRMPYRPQPEQIHLAYGGAPSKMIVTWLTFDDTEHSYGFYGEDHRSMDRQVNASIFRFVDGGHNHTVRYIHRAMLTDIKPGRRYFYRVGSEHGWSSIFSFVGLNERAEGGYVFAVYGDMGNVNARSLGKLQRMSQDGDFDMIIHNGDFAYNMNVDEGAVGDEFMRQIEPMAAYIPCMVSVGNHESAYNFSHYVNRFTMPDSDHNLFYSFDLGAAHFIALSSEFYFYADHYGSAQIQTQWNWLLNDLKKANENRKAVPWIIVYAHRAMYCTDIPANECKKEHDDLRDGVGPNKQFGLEKILYKYGVDLYIGAHEHNYEVIYPIYNWTMHKGQEAPFTDPPVPVHVTTGSAGCTERTNPFPQHPAPFSAFRSSNYGFTKMQIFNSTHINIQQLLAAEDKVEHEFWLIKHKHPRPSRRPIG